MDYLKNTLLVYTYTGKNMKYAWRTHAYTHSRLSSQVSIGTSSVDSGLFIPEADEADPKIQAFLTNINHRKARQTEDDFDAEVVKRLSYYLRAKHHDD